jgi:hypothetical protein
VLFYFHSSKKGFTFGRQGQKTGTMNGLKNVNKKEAALKKV